MLKERITDKITCIVIIAGSLMNPTDDVQKKFFCDHKNLSFYSRNGAPITFIEWSLSFLENRCGNITKEDILFIIVQIVHVHMDPTNIYKMDINLVLKH